MTLEQAQARCDAITKRLGEVNAAMTPILNEFNRVWKPLVDEKAALLKEDAAIRSQFEN